MPYRLPAALLQRSFDALRVCGRGQGECQVLWTSAWTNPEDLTELVHPVHQSHGAAFELDSAWISRFWIDLAHRGHGIRVQVHTHPGAAFHSTTDDAYPIIHAVGFLSLVIPTFALGPVGFEGAYLAEIDARGRFVEVPVGSRLQLT